tara:strand:- start:83 stop:484 length:402 start_codon:yes stop_codon:yes gene_type:complete
MAHFAELDENNTVLRVLVVSNDVTTTDGVETEQDGIDFLNNLFPDSGTWVQTSYNHNMRGSFAGTNWTYDPKLDIFCEPLPFPSWTHNESTGRAQAPVPFPSEGDWIWNEEEQKWDEWVPKGTPEDDPSKDQV